MSWWGGDSRHEATQAALEVCGAKYGHTINPEFTGWSGHYEKLTTQIAGPLIAQDTDHFRALVEPRAEVVVLGAGEAWEFQNARS